MADVSRAGLPTSSSKHVYDGVFSLSRAKSSRIPSFNDDDYGEVFGCSKLGNGGWQSSYCSIPVVELPASEQRVRGVRAIEMDYGGVLGGFSDEGLGLISGDELFDQLKKKARISPPVVGVPRAKSEEQTKEVSRSGIPSHSQNVQSSMDGINKSSTCLNYYKQKTNDIPSNTTNVNHFCSTSVPTSTSHEDVPMQEVQNGQTSVVKADTQFDLGVNEWETEHDAGFPRVPELRELNLAATSNDPHQFVDQLSRASHDVDSSHKVPISETRVFQSDIVFEVGINPATEGNHDTVIGVNELKNELDASSKKAHDFSGPNSAATSCTAQPELRELNSAVTSDDSHRFTNQLSRASHDVDSSHKAPISETPVIQADTDSKVDINLTTEGKYDWHSTPEIDVNELKRDVDAGSKKATHDFTGSNSASTCTAQPCTVVDESDVKENNFRVNGFSNSDSSKQNDEAHSASYQESCSSSSCSAAFDSGNKFGKQSRMSSFDLGRQSHDHDAGGSHRKSRLGSSYSFDASHDPSTHMKVQPSKVIPSSSQPHFFRMESRYKISENSKSGSSLPSLDDQIDMNSSSAILAFALQRAVEEAEMQIHLAKEFLERESRGSIKLRFKDTLKMEVMKENMHVNKINNGVKKKKNVIECCSPVDDVTVSSHFGRNRVLETARFVPNHKGDDTKVPECIEKGGENEGGEWEATKHLNQIITGVKNRLASFMTWQGETEKGESKEVESIIKRPHSSDDGCEPKETVENESVNMTANIKEVEEDVTRAVPSYIECEESGPHRSYTAGQEKVGGVVDSTVDAERSGRTNFSFFSFTHLPKQTEMEEESQESAEIEIENRQKVVDTVVHEQIECRDNEAHEEMLINSIYDECMATIEEHHPMAAPETNEVSREEDNDSELSQEENVLSEEGYAGDCPVDERHQDEHVISEEASDRRVIEESECDRSASIPEAVNDTEVNEESESDTHASFHESDDTRVNEVYTSIHDDRTVIEEHGDDRSRPGDEAENRKLTEEHREEPMDNVVEDDNDKDEIEVSEESEDQSCNAQLHEKIARAGEERSESPVNDIEVSGQMDEVEEDHGSQNQPNHVEETIEMEQASCMEDVVLSKAEEAACRTDGSDVGIDTEFADEDERIMEKNDFASDVKMGVEIPAPFDEVIEEKMEMSYHSSESEIITDHPEEKTGLACGLCEDAMDFDVTEHRNENPVLSECVNCGPTDVADGEETETATELDEIGHQSSIDSAFLCEDSVPHRCVTDVDNGQNDVIDVKETELKPEDNIANQTIHLYESNKTLDIGDHETEKCNVEVVHRRKRWFENQETIGAVDRPNLVVDQDVLEETDVAESVESETTEVNVRQSDTVSNHRDGQVNVETTHKRRRWFVKRGEQGLPQSPGLFPGIDVTSELDHEVDECVNRPNSEADEVVVSVEKDKQNVEAGPRRKRWFENIDNVGPTTDGRSTEDDRPIMEVNQEQEDPVSGSHREDMEAENRRKKEKEKEKLAVERAIREARERAFAEAKERARREAPNKVKVGPTEADLASDKASIEMKIRAERAAVERATAEVRERALQKALSEKSLRGQSGRNPPERSSSLEQTDPKYGSRSLDPSNINDKLDEGDGESAQRRKARLERQNRTMERAAKALEEKNKRDLLVQKEQAARNVLAEALDAEVKRWSNGKEGNVRALLSTLQYILGSDSGWQAVSLTDLVAPTAVRKAYKKATLCVHPDKLQQRGASIQQKYICEKVFDLLKDAWSRFNPDER